MTRDEAKDIRNGFSARTQDVVNVLIDEIYDSFESRTCESCKYRGEYKAECHVLKFVLETSVLDTVSTFSCKKWEEKER